MRVLSLFLVAVFSSSVFAIPPKDPNLAEDVRVTVLSDMVTSYMGAKFTHAAWGFGALVEIKENGKWKKLLFDTGSEPKNLIKNAKVLGIDLCDIEHVVLSHNHSDHTAGLVQLRETCKKKNKKAFSVAHIGSEEFFWSRPIRDRSDRIVADDNLMVKDAPRYRKAGGTFVHGKDGASSTIPGFNSAILTGKILPRYNNEKTAPEGELVDPSGKILVDDVPEDQALVIRTVKGLVVITGCAHAGTYNTVAKAIKDGGNTPIYALIGGFHLFAKKIGDINDPATLNWLVKKLKPLAIQMILGAHCTGFEKLAYLRKELSMTDKTAMISTIDTRFGLHKGFSHAELNTPVE